MVRLSAFLYAATGGAATNRAKPSSCAYSTLATIKVELLLLNAPTNSDLLLTRLYNDW